MNYTIILSIGTAGLTIFLPAFIMWFRFHKEKTIRDTELRDSEYLNNKFKVIDHSLLEKYNKISDLQEKFKNAYDNECKEKNKEIQNISNNMIKFEMEIRNLKEQMAELKGDLKRIRDRDEQIAIDIKRIDNLSRTL